MKLPITTYEVDHHVVMVSLFEDADGKSVSAEDIVKALNATATTPAAPESPARFVVELGEDHLWSGAFLYKADGRSADDLQLSFTRNKQDAMAFDDMEAARSLAWRLLGTSSSNERMWLVVKA